MSSDFLDMRLRRYVPAGAAGPVIPTQSIDWTAPMGDVATLNFTVSETVAGKFPDLCEFAVELFDGTSWKEPRSGRFMNQKATGDDLDRTGMKNITTVSFIHWMLAKAEFQTGTGEDHEFDATAGSILRTMIDAAKARGWGKFITVTFNAATDSAGKPWSDTARVEMSFRDGTTISQALQTLADQGVLEYATEGRTLHVYNPGTGSDHSGGSERSTVGAKVQEMPVETTNEDLLTAVTVRGDDKSWTFPVPGGVTSLGRLEGSVQASGVTKESQAVRFAELLQTTGKAPRAQYTITESAEAMDARPFADYGLGDWISARRPGGWERMRVTEIQMHRSDQGELTADITLEDRLTDLAARLTKRNAALGAKLAGNGNISDRLTTASLKSMLDGMGFGGGGIGGGGMEGPVNPRPEYGSGWPSGGANFEWGSEGSDPNTTPEYADAGFTVSDVHNINLPDAAQNEGNLIFSVSYAQESFFSRVAGLTGGPITVIKDGNETGSDDKPISTPKPVDKDEAEEDDEDGGFDWLPDDPEHDPIEDPIDKPVVPDEGETENPPEGEPKTLEEALADAVLGSVTVTAGYAYGGQVYDWADRLHSRFNSIVIAKLIKNSTPAKQPGNHVYYDPYKNRTISTRYYMAGVGFRPEKKPFSVNGWLYIPVAVQVYWEAYTPEGQVTSSFNVYALRFLRSKIQDHRTLGEFEAVEKAEVPVMAEYEWHEGNATFTARAGNQIIVRVPVLGSEDFGYDYQLFCAAFGQSGDIEESEFSRIPHPVGTVNKLVVAKSLDGSGMSIFTESGQELLVAADNVRRRDVDTLWGEGTLTQGDTTPSHVVAGRVTRVQYCTNNVTEATVRVGVLNASGQFDWSKTEEEADPRTGWMEASLRFSYGGYVYGTYGDGYGFGLKLTPA